MPILCRRDQLTNESSLGIELNGVAYLVVARQQQLYVYRNRCPHLGVELNWLPDRFLTDDRQLIQCATHGALFSIETGECLAGPCVGEYLQAIPHRISENNDIIIDD